MIESPTTVGHVGSLIVLDPSTAPGGAWDLDTVRGVIEARLHLSPIFRQRLVEVPLGLSRPYWVDDPHFDIEFHIRELAIPAPGSDQQLGEQVARIHARALDRQRPLWELYVISGLADGRAAVYSKVHHAAIDGVSGAEILASVLDIRPEPREVVPEAQPFVPRRAPVDRSAWSGEGSPRWRPTRRRSRAPCRQRCATSTSSPARAVPVWRVSSPTSPQPWVDSGRREAPGGERQRPEPQGATHSAQRNHHRTSTLLVRLRAAVRHQDGAQPVRRDRQRHRDGAVHVGAAPVAARPRRATPRARWWRPCPSRCAAGGEKGAGGNQISVMLAELPTHLPDPEERLVAMRAAMDQAKARFDAVPATLLRDLSMLVPTAGSGLAARQLFNLATVPGHRSTSSSATCPDRRSRSTSPAPRSRASIRCPRSPASPGHSTSRCSRTTVPLDFGLIACREMVPDVWNLIGHLKDALAELVELSE